MTVALPTLDLRDPSTYPTRRAEAWKWSDVRARLRVAPAPSPEVQIAPGGPFARLGGVEAAFANGRALGDAVIEAIGTLRLRFVSEADGTGHQASAVVRVPAGQSLLVLESYEGAGRAYASNVALRFEVGEGAVLERIVLIEEAEDALAISTAEILPAAGARVFQTTLTRGAGLQRHETRVAHPGLGVTVELNSVYALAGERHADLATVVTHAGLDGVTQQLTKGVVADRARGVFQGKIVVLPGADGTDARMGHHALILSDRAEVDAKPELEIFADDVACAHGNTVGALDEDALFYIRARGVPEDEARALLTEAFLHEALDPIAREDVRETLAARLAAWRG